ncbi:hypothetical protein PRN20_15475 [Devosia sp. ZB163]|uniref:hypothetical protein n=1 Tax=Devosia sp. ZB163 TaxID=3025938 RepID=UPI0023605857|nr:hypothetical protein [Devosia sp. ZB163]MDC9825131.1 hypothetical protein [Devosia sp. ZB163]
MTKILPVLIALALLPSLQLPALAGTQLANSGLSPYCGPDGAANYKAPGGFCDQLDDLNTLMPKGDGEVCGNVAETRITFDDKSGRLLVAVPDYDPCCHVTWLNNVDLPVEAIRVATAC